MTVVTNAGCISIGRAKVKGPFVPEAPRPAYRIGYSVYCCYDNTAVLAFPRVLAGDISKASIGKPIRDPQSSPIVKALHTLPARHGGHRPTTQLDVRIHQTGRAIDVNMLRRYRVVPPNSPPRIVEVAREACPKEYKGHEGSHYDDESGEDLPHDDKDANHDREDLAYC